MVKPYLSSAHKDKDGLVTGWRDIHTILANKSGVGRDAVPEMLGYAVYYYAVYRAFGQEQDAVRAKELLSQLLLLLARNPPVGGWSAAGLDDMVVLAWLQAELVQYAVLDPGKPDPLAEWDLRLLTGATHLIASASANRAALLRIVRYFCLRLPQQLAPGQWEQVTDLIERLLSEKVLGFVHPAPAGAPATRLGLADGLAGELLLLVQLAERGIFRAGIMEQVRQGILSILAAKREVDFSEKKYAIFPDEIGSGPEAETRFSNELSWRTSDLGQALLFYKSYELLQDQELVRLAELVGLNTLLRADVRTTAITTAEFGSGAAGVAHLYRKLYQLSGHEAYRKGYAYWLTQTRSWLTHELHTDFYQHREHDLRRGLVGVGLVLLSAISEQEIGWDRALL
ncbi:lanthionine synthetase-like protein [Hymenobacter chitinivorans DSM 11115]|uniref:Lanthionine synthetase-like protein n=2 Tax=Hymenobacter chitinivorans TaxID=89969 RepID=A0A2M9APU1_9BACT|nr:lanthionine synthetase-like protein [Hymenobacter chitinivorans DSM 11115]